MNIRQKIIEEKARQGLSNRKLATLAGLQTYQLGQYLKGLKSINSNSIEKILTVLKLKF